jgi:prepilin-type N-terminal cleavage/methylation domain-containing protein/prepilin-type processing-associated H-X9-DG protein
MWNAEGRLQNTEQSDKREELALQSRLSSPRSALCALRSAFYARAFTLVEMLVVMAIIAILAGLVGALFIHARNLSIRVECQQNLNHIGQTVSLLVLSHNGLFPMGPPVDGQNNLRQDGLSNAYPEPLPNDPYAPLSNGPNPQAQNDAGFPWWARLFEQWDDLGLLFAENTANKNPATGLPAPYLTTGYFDPALNPNGHLLKKGVLPERMNVFHCRMAGALDGSKANLNDPSDTTDDWSVINLFNSLSYGINFDVKDSGGAPYCSRFVGDWNSTSTYNVGDIVRQNPTFYSCLSPNSNSAPPNSNWQSTAPCSPSFPNSLSAADVYPDQYRATEIQDPSQFILISEANTEGPEWIAPSPPPALPKPVPRGYREPLQQGYWTGGRISPWSNFSVPASISTWSSSTAYQPGQVVSDNVEGAPHAYRCILPITSNVLPPLDPAHWELLQGIVGRHGGYANVLFADFHVEAMQVAPGQTAANLNINYNTPLWLLPNK